ncbi:MAG TPA: hypothetical protein VNV85_14435 [Puia sp.]|jgi:hypothetical protein|nr:hypothetical protein [Puia sp.]
MKKILIILISLFSVFHCNSQGISNFFSQGQTDIKYMLQQIAALQVYVGYAEKGYGIAQAGLTFIGELKKGELDLHSMFFNSLKAVNPSIANYAKVADIISYQQSIVKNFKKILLLKNMRPAELKYLSLVYNNITTACSKSLDDLINLLSGDTYTMHDNERICRIENIYTYMKDKYAFTQSFTNEAGLLSVQRTNELSDINFLKNLN